MFIDRLIASVFIFDCREFLLRVELHLTRVHSSFAVIFCKASGGIFSSKKHAVHLEQQLQGLLQLEQDSS